MICLLGLCNVSHRCCNIKILKKIEDGAYWLLENATDYNYKYFESNNFIDFQILSLFSGPYF